MQNYRESAAAAAFREEVKYQCNLDRASRTRFIEIQLVRLSYLAIRLQSHEICCHGSSGLTCTKHLTVNDLQFDHCWVPPVRRELPSELDPSDDIQTRLPASRTESWLDSCQAALSRDRQVNDQCVRGERYQHLSRLV